MSSQWGQARGLVIPSGSNTFTYRSVTNEPQFRHVGIPVTRGHHRKTTVDLFALWHSATRHAPFVAIDAGWRRSLPTQPLWLSPVRARSRRARRQRVSRPGWTRLIGSPRSLDDVGIVDCKRHDVAGRERPGSVDGYRQLRVAADIDEQFVGVTGVKYAFDGRRHRTRSDSHVLRADERGDSRETRRLSRYIVTAERRSDSRETRRLPRNAAGVSKFKRSSDTGW